MSLTLSDHASAIRAKLVEIKDTSQIAHSLLTDSSLTTVMGSSGNKGFRKEQQRLDAVQNDADIISALAPLSDNSAAVKAVAEHVKNASAARAKAVFKACYSAVKISIFDKASSELDLAMKAVDILFAELKTLVSAAVAQDDSMTTQRKKAQEDFDASIKVIKDAVTLISTIEINICSTQSEIDTRFDSTQILQTAQDPDRANLAQLRKDLESQKSYHERAMLEHFSRAARTRTSDTRSYSQELVIPDQLITKGRGLELIDVASGHMLSHVPQYFTLAPYHQRIGDDYNSADGTFWKPPDKSTDFSDVPAEIRDIFITQNRAYAQYILSKLSPDVAAVVLSTHIYGLYKQFEGKADEDDGLAIYYGLVSLSRPSASAYREEIDLKLTNAPEQFRNGNPLEKIKDLRPFLTEAVRLKMRIKWTVGKKIITTLALRHSTFAVELSSLKETAPNSDDAAGHIDRLFSAITSTCHEIQAIQGDRWQNTFANFSHSNNSFNDNKQRECRYGDKCFRTDCSFYHKSGKSARQGKGQGSTHRDNNRNNTQSSSFCEAKGCRQRTAGKKLKLCTTCYKKGIQSGSLSLKDGSSMNFKKAQLAKKSKSKDSKKKDSPVFNPEQLQVLHQIHANSVTKTDMQHAITDVPAGPASAKIDTVFSRLGHSTQSQSNQVTSALLSITGNQQ